MEPLVKSSLLWGLTGALTFLVLVQAYQLLTGEFIDFSSVVAVTGVVGGVTALAAYAGQTWVRERWQ